MRIKRALDPDALIVLVVNRNFKDVAKGYPMIENVLRGISNFSIQVVLVGNNSEWAASRLPEQLNVRHYGFIESREELADLYSLADIFLFASPDENFPCVILEAMAAGCCVVSTPTDGVVEQIEDGVSGLLSSNVDAASLAKSLVIALADRNLARRLGQAAQLRVRKYFSISAMIDRYLNLSMSLLPGSEK
jgi:glycosyltransferase involved in cell wall biosynthesis